MASWNGILSSYKKWKRLLELGNDEAECQTWSFSRGLDGYLVQRAIIPNLPTTQGPLSYH